MKELIIKIIAGIILGIEILVVSTTEVGVIGLFILGVIGLACLILIGSEFRIITDDTEELESR